MLDVIIGSNHKRQECHELLEAIGELGLDEGSFYVGYPILAGPDEKWTLDALLVSPQYGVVVFDLLDTAPTPESAESYWQERLEYEDQLARGLTAKLVIQKELTKGRNLAFDVQVVAFGPHHFGSEPPDEPTLFLANRQSLKTVLGTFTGFASTYLPALNAAIERVSTIKPRNKRSNVAQQNSRGAVLKVIEKQIANLDRWQKRGAIESPEGPQRIRGLAGSGKTVVLALKAAYLHSQNPEWTIIITYQTRALYEQFKDLVRRFCYESMNDEPDWTKVLIMPGWGTVSDPGVYAVLEVKNGFAPRTFGDAKFVFGYSNAMAGVCREALAHQLERRATLCDALLIDEAQDFPPEFFQLVLEAVPDPHRIVWAYDELQNLNETTMPPLDELFGRDAEGNPRVDLSNAPDEPHRDIILPKCYRNPPWTLTIAHGLGFGTTRRKGLVQAFDEPMLWHDIGYEVVSGSLSPGSEVVLQRRPDASPDFFRELLDPKDAFKVMKFATLAEQTEWVAQQIQENLERDELEPSDILVIYPKAVSVPEDAGPLVSALAHRRIPAHIAGVNVSRNMFIQQGSVAISGIYRAKGNEAAMVYLMNADYCVQGYELLKRRNTLFTALTRSRAWVRVCGVGEEMDSLSAEIQAIVNDGYRLRYRVPTTQELARLRSIHRDRTEVERKKADEATQGIAKVLDALEQGVISREDLTPEVRTKLEQFLKPSK